MIINKIAKVCDRFCATPSKSCEYYYECCMIMCEAIKLGIDTPPMSWNKSEIKLIEKECLKCDWYKKI